MEKTMAKKTRLLKTVNMINTGSTWSEVEQEFKVTRAYLQKLLRDDYYKTETGYNNLLARARQNEKEKRSKTVIVSETGALFRGFDIPRGVKVMIPRFCKKEVWKHAFHNGVKAQDVINNPKFTWVQREQEFLNVRAEKGSFKPRTVGIVALCCRLIKEGFAVRCITTSREISELAKLQNLSEKSLEIIKL